MALQRKMSPAGEFILLIKAFADRKAVVLFRGTTTRQKQGRCGRTTIEVEKRISPLRNSQGARVAPVEMTVVQFGRRKPLLQRQKKKTAHG
jgi:hypothetical protein